MARPDEMVVSDVIPALSDVLRAETRDLHRQAERTGIIANLLRGSVSRFGYALFLRNLHPVYEHLEQGLDRHRERPALGPFARPEVYRAASLTADLETLAGPRWSETLPLTEAGLRYADRVATAAKDSGDRLLGHVYVRYFGDLNGGQILKRRLRKAADLPPESLSFYDFPDIEDMEAFLRSYRRSLDAAAGWIGDQDQVVDAALEAFSLNIQLSQAVQSVTVGGLRDFA